MTGPGNADSQPVQRRLRQQEERIRDFEKGRNGPVPPAHREALARALGLLVSRIDPMKPKAGLKRIMDSLGPEKASIRAHRKRVVLLPDEHLPERHVWMKHWAEYLGFARCALKLMETGTSKDAHINRELESLIRIGRVGAAAPPVSNSLLENWAATMVAKTLDQSMIQELWQELDRMPFTIGEADDTGPEGPLAMAAQAARAVAKPGTECQRLRFTPVSSRQILGRDNARGQLACFCGASPELMFWALPSIDLGWVCYKGKQSVFVLPHRFRGLEESIEHWTGTVGWENVPDALAWLESIGGRFDGEVGWAPDIAYSEDEGFGWHENRFFVLSRLGLTLAPGDDGSPTLFMEMSDAHGCIPELRLDDPMEDSFDFVERMLNELPEAVSDFVPDFPNLTRLQTPECARQILGVDDGMFEYRNGLVFMKRVRAGDVSGPPPVEDTWPWDMAPPWLDGISAPLTDRPGEERDAVLYRQGHAYRFFPSFAFDETRPAAAPAGSIAAALIANTHEPSEQRLSTLLVERARAIADAGLTYAQALRAYHEDAIRNM